MAKSTNFLWPCSINYVSLPEGNQEEGVDFVRIMAMAGWEIPAANGAFNGRFLERGIFHCHI